MPLYLVWMQFKIVTCASRRLENKERPENQRRSGNCDPRRVCFRVVRAE